MKKRLLPLFLVFAPSLMVACNNNPVSSSESEVSKYYLSITREAYKKEFYYGEEFTHDGLRVLKINVDDEDDRANVTPLCTITEPDMSVEGEHEIVISYQGLTTSYTITVINSCERYNVTLSEIYDFYETLESFPTNVNEVHTEAITTDSYITGGIPMTMIYSTVYDGKRYSDIIDIHGSYALLNDDMEITSETTYVSQTGYDNINYYQIVDYADSSWQDTKEEISKASGNEESIFNLSYFYSMGPTISMIAGYFGVETIGLVANGINDYVDGADEWTFSLTLTQYDSTYVTAPLQSYEYSVTLKFNGGKISRSETHLIYSIYASSTSRQTKDTYTDIDYKYGEYPSFEGTRLDPTKY